MKRITIFLICSILIIISFIPQINSDEPIRGTTLYVGGTGAGNYTTIQSAINYASSGDTIFAYSGTYYENLIVNKTINLIGEGINTSIDGKNNLALYLIEDGCLIKNIKISNCSSWFGDGCVKITSNNNTISSCFITNGWSGISLLNCYGNTIGDCKIYDIYSSDGGINIQNSHNNTVYRCNVSNNNNRGIILGSNSYGNLISNCICNSNLYGISLQGGIYNNITKCTMKYNTQWGILISSNYNNISSCNFSYNKNGINFQSGIGNILRNNSLFENEYNLGLQGFGLSKYYQDIDDSNMINGKPIIYLIGKNNLEFNDTNEIGFLGLVSCKNITLINFTTNGIQIANTSANIENCSSSNSFIGIGISYSSKIKILNCNVSNNYLGTNFYESSNICVENCEFYNSRLYVNSNFNLIINNTIKGHGGIELCGDFNKICSNEICLNSGSSSAGLGITAGSEDNFIFNNYIHDNKYGMTPGASDGNIIYLNIFENNTDYNNLGCPNQENRYYKKNVTYSYNGDFFKDTVGNYWDDYTGTDTDGNGIGETPYYFHSGGMDNYPMIKHPNNYNLISLPPWAMFVNNPKYPIKNQIITFDASPSYDPDGNILYYTWSFGDGTTNSGMIVNHTFLNCGIYNVTLTVMDNDYITENITRKIVISHPINVFVDDDFNYTTVDWNVTKFNTIFDGIDAVSENGTVFVYNGTYFENVVVYKTINLTGENRDNTIINGCGKEDTVNIKSDYVNLSNFSITGSGNIYLEDAGVDIEGNYTSLFGNIIKYNRNGIKLTGSVENFVMSNFVINNYDDGIRLYYSSFNIIKGNNITDNQDEGIELYTAYENCIKGNIVSNNLEDGICLRYSSENNTINDNSVTDNHDYGIVIRDSSDNNLIYHNTLLNNSQNAFDEFINNWDNGYPSGGNYWDDYSGDDNFHGQNQDIPVSDGIGDNPYGIPGGSNQDLYPLINPWREEPKTVAIWHFDEGTDTVVYDSSGNNYHGTIHNSNWCGGISGTALEYDELNDYVNFSSPVRNTPPFTVCVWVKPVSITTGFHYILANGGETMHSHGFALILDNDNISGNSEGWEFDVRNNDIGGYCETPALSEQWSFICGSWDGTSNTDSIKLYINGFLASTLTPASKSSSTNENNLRVGTASNSLNYFFDGVIDEISIFNKILTNYEIFSLYQKYPKTIVYVDDDYNSSTPGWQYDHFDVIQDGIDAVAENGTVYVFKGTYYENVVVDKSIDLIGEDRNSTIITCPGTYDEIGITILSDWVNISEIKISNTWSYGHTGIRVNSNNSFIHDCILYGNGDDGMTIFGDITLIKNNYFDNNGDGIGIGDLSSNNLIFNNIIINCHDDGIYGGSNNNISNNSIINSADDGIYLYQQSNNRIQKNLIQENAGEGLTLKYSDFNTIINNDISNNSDNGILVWDSNNNNISNTSSSSNYVGIRFSDNSNNNVFYNCSFFNNTHGIVMQSTGQNNSILHCTVSNNNAAIGIDWGGNNKFIDNQIINNSAGVAIGYESSSNYNALYHNSFINNNYNAKDNCINYWDNGYPSGGNYWDDYTGTDIDGDGIGDTPYSIPGGSNQDNYPLGAFHPIADYTYSPTNPTRLDVIQFNDASFDPDGTIVNWSWSFGDGYGSSLQNPTHQYTDLGTYQVNLTVWDNENSSNTTQQLITIINCPPRANFSYSPLYPDVNQTISFSDDSIDFDGIITNWHWDFGDGYSSILQNPVHQYQNRSIYEVSLTVTDNDGGSKTIKKIVPVDTSLYSFVNLSSGWNFVSIPCNLSVLLDDLIIKYDESLYTWSTACSDLNPTGTPFLNEYVFGWNRLGQYYVFANSLEPGYGSWLYAIQDCQLLVDELPLNPDTYITTLEPGWNMIANPHLPNHDFTLLLFKYQGVFYDWTEATTDDNPTNSPLINPYLFGWNPFQYYIFASEFEPGKAYWAYAYTQCQVHATTWK